MSLDFVQTIPSDQISSLLRKFSYGLVTTCVLGAAVYIGYRVAAPDKYSIKQHRHPELNDQIEKVVASLKITDEQLQHIMRTLEEEMSAGLSPATHKQASVKMFPSYVRHISKGTEVGQVLALDLGGTNFRILLIKLRGNSKIDLTSKIFVVPQSVMIGDGRHLFRHLVECLSDFMKRETLLHSGITYPLGFTFSFPCKQESLSSARLTSWTKGFSCAGVVNEDVVKLLQDAIDEK
ncbi:unnamed protein product, partial [Rotaria sp. Silwood2]